MKQIIYPAILLCCVVTLATSASAGAAELEVKFVGTQHQTLFDIDFNDNSGLAVGGAGFMLRSEDGGRSWKKRGLQGIREAVLGVDVGPETTLLVGQDGLILRSKPEGGWKQINSPAESRLFDVAANTHGLAIAVGEFGSVLISRDAGKHWQLITMPWAELNDQGLEPHLYTAHVDEHGWITLAGEFESIIRSTDAGATWTQLHTGDATIFDLEILEDGTGYAVGQDGLFLKTVQPVNARQFLPDQGEAAGSASDKEPAVAWQRMELNSDANLLSVAADPAGRIFVSGMRQFWHSKDGGQSWQAVQGESIHRMWFQSVTRGPEGQFFTVGKRGTLGLLAE